jgi:post-segregation antitoxin (ccd killing protein)
MAEKKAVLNVTVDESVAEAIRQEAAFRNVTISSVVEAALAEQIKWHKIRMAGLAAIDEEYQESGYPTAAQEAAAHAVVAEQMRVLAEMLAAEDAQRAEQSANSASPGIGTGAA